MASKSGSEHKCPLCGGSAIVLNRGVYFVECTGQCKLRGPLRDNSEDALAAFLKIAIMDTEKGSLEWALSLPSGTRLQHASAPGCVAKVHYFPSVDSSGHLTWENGIAVTVCARHLTGWSFADPEIKPCPWCKDTLVTVSRDPGSGPYVDCRMCRARGPRCATREDAINRWNDAKR